MTDKPTFDAGAHAQVKGFYDREYYGGHALARPSWHLRRIARRLRLRAGMRVLDVACGDGAWLQLLAAAGAEPHGVDISSVAVGRCRERLPGADIREAIAESLPHADAGFDLVTCMGSLEHFLDKPAALAEMRRVARPDARFLLLVPNAGFLTRRLGLYRGTEQTRIREDVLPLAEWERLLGVAGLTIRRRWRDLHPLSVQWITLGSPLRWPVRLVQALALAAWPLAWQYQVYFLCTQDADRTRQAPADG
jgi:SAM-dependent methyltransferase